MKRSSFKELITKQRPVFRITCSGSNVPGSLPYVIFDFDRHIEKAEFGMGAMKITLNAKKNYIEYGPGDVDRSMTIAAFYVTQGTSEKDYDPLILPTASPMRRDVLRFLTSPSAVNYWLNDMGWLVRNPDDANYLQLTSPGQSTISSSYSQSRNTADPVRVRNWICWMTCGGGETEESRQFEGPVILPEGQRSGKKTEEEAKQLMAAYFRSNKDSLPADVRVKREQIIERIMNGEPEDEAFRFD